jgi:hypothetical protein
VYIIEGTDAWDMELTSDQDSGYIHKEDFVNQENVLRAYTRTSNETIDTSLLSAQGLYGKWACVGVWV